MIIYVFDKDTKEYQETKYAQPNPMREGEFLVPPNSTTEQLPIMEEKETALFLNEHWVVKPDFRGEYVLNRFSNSIEQVDYIGEIPQGYVLDTLENLQAYLMEPEAYKIVDDKIISIRGSEEYQEYLESIFNKSFISTNLGYVRVNTAWGNFLSIKPNYDFQVQQFGFLPPNVLILYRKPSFSFFQSYDEVEHWLITKGQYKNSRVESNEYAQFSAQVLEFYTGEEV